MEKNINKKFLGIIALSCAFVLSACDPVKAMPANYNDPILMGENGAVETKDNIMGKIYDVISANRNQKVLDKIVNELLVSKYGTFNEIYEASLGNDEEKLEYVNKHAECFVRENDTNELKLARFNNFVDDVAERISESFYSLITSGSYNDSVTGMFDEEILYTKLKADLWDLQENVSGSWNKFYVTSELTKENALSHLHVNLYSWDESVPVPGAPENYKAKGYIENKIFPSILKDKLVEQYIFDNNYSALGRSYAREVNYVKVSYTSSNLKYIEYVVKNYVDSFVYNAAGAEQLNFDYLDKTVIGFEGINTNVAEDNILVNVTNLQGNEYAPYTFNYIENCHEVNKAYWESLNGKADQKEMVKVNAKSDKEEYVTLDGMQIFPDTADFELYPDTKLGELLDSYNKALTARDAGNLATAEDKAELDKFSSGKSLADALRDKIINLAKEDNTTDGWYVKNGGISDLPSALRDRLFNINVANDLEDGYILETAADRELGKYRYVDGDVNGQLVDRVPYARNIEGRKFIMASNAEGFNINHDNFVYTDGNAFYMCQVLEAPSTPKLDVENAKAYKTSEGEVDYETIEATARTIAKILSTKDTYANNAYTKYFETYAFEFFDTSLYDYLRAEYPDLFDTED